MTRFDYLRSAPHAPFAAAMNDRWRVPALTALACVVVLAGTWMIQHKALDDAMRTEHVYDAAMQSSEAAVRRSRKRYRSISLLLRLRSQARSIELSSRTQARLFFQLARAVPDHVWLTSVTRDGSGLLVSGQARSFDSIAELLGEMSAAGTFKDPALASAAVTEDRSKTPFITYQVHVDLDATRAS